MAARSWQLAVGPLELLEEAREVVQADDARDAAGPERVEDVGHRDLVHHRRRPRPGEVAEAWPRGSRASSVARAEASSRRGRADASGRRRRTPRSASTGRRSGSPREPGMPLITSLSLRRPKRSCSRSPARPHQFARMPIYVVGWLITAGVHSTVWILAISAALISRARSKRSSSDHDGYSAAQPVADRVVLADEDDLHQRRSRARSPAPAPGRARSSGGSGSSAVRPGSAACRPSPERRIRCSSSELP